MNSTQIKVVASTAWTYGMSMPSRTFTARVESKMWADGVVLATAYDDIHDAGTFRGRIARTLGAWRTHAPMWTLTDEAGVEIGQYRTRREALEIAGNRAIEAFAHPLRVSTAAAEREQASREQASRMWAYLLNASTAYRRGVVARSSR